MREQRDHTKAETGEGGGEKKENRLGAERESESIIMINDIGPEAQAATPIDIHLLLTLSIFFENFHVPERLKRGWNS